MCGRKLSAGLVLLVLLLALPLGSLQAGDVVLTEGEYNEVMRLLDEQERQLTEAESKLERQAQIIDRQWNTIQGLGTTFDEVKQQVRQFEISLNELRNDQMIERLVNGTITVGLLGFAVWGWIR
jgi:septal ring factor EnvC (AmiA/AmiB activator)